MKTTIAAFFLFMTALAVSLRADDTPQVDSEGIKLVAKALVAAKQEGKHVLLQFSSQGCTWCRVLENLFERDQAIAAELKNNYVFVAIDVSDGRNRDVDFKYGDPQRNGVPVIVILDADGKQLVVKGKGIVEGDPKHAAETFHINPVTMLSFLKQWAPKK